MGVGDIVVKCVLEYLNDESRPKEERKIRLDMAFEILKANVPYGGIANDIKEKVMEYINFKEKN
jgi:hypothetical protein